jgi:glycine/serine hydroxymethyltransferase
MDEEQMGELIDRIYHAVGPILEGKPLSEALAAAAAAFWDILHAPFGDKDEQLCKDIARLYAVKIDPSLMDAIRAHFDTKKDLTEADTRLYVVAGLMEGAG